MSFLIIFFLFFNIIKLIDSLAALKFKTFHQKLSFDKKDTNGFNTQDFAQSILISKIYFELIIGNETSENQNNIQILNIFTVSDYKFYIKSFKSFDISEEDKYLCNYSQILSETYKIINPNKNLGEESFKIYKDIK